jgi:hypothetical protein
MGLGKAAGSSMRPAWTIVHEVDSLKATARDAAEQFARTCNGGRDVVWHVDGKFHLAGGVKLYEVRAYPNGWKVVELRGYDEP